MSENNSNIPDTRETRLSGPTGSAMFGLWTRAAPGEGPSAAPTYAPYGQPYPATFDPPHSQLQDHPPDHFTVRARNDKNQIAQNLPVQQHQHQARPVVDSHAVESLIQPLSGSAHGATARYQQFQVLTAHDFQRPCWPSLTAQDPPHQSCSGTGSMWSHAGEEEFPQSQHLWAHEYQAQRYRAQRYLAQRYQAQQHQAQQHQAQQHQAQQHQAQQHQAQQHQAQQHQAQQHQAQQYPSHHHPGQQHQIKQCSNQGSFGHKGTVNSGYNNGDMRLTGQSSPDIGGGKGGRGTDTR